ncbi:MAG: a-glycosyltransferase, Glycosyltransferase Family 4-like protein [Variovorax sp.]|jgi:glycogen(starch) synthase|nr:a-glycosyltransferase, Glycosyltransferase Family 4-like protein [Variovorax sp.]
MAAELESHRTVARVLMTADTVGGVWNHAVELAALLAAAGTQVALATMGAPPSAAQRAQVAALPSVTLHESAWRLEWMPAPWADLDEASRWLLQLERQFEPDVVHLNQFAFGALPFKAPKLVVAHSCVMSWWQAVHGEAAPAQWNPYRRAVARGLAGADLVGAPTQDMLASLARNHGHRRPGVVVPSARDAGTYFPRRKEPFILSAGRLWDPAKNVAALDAVAHGLPWPVRVAGSTEAPSGATATLRVSGGVTLLGELAPEALARQLSRAAIYALPARYEPFGQSVLEAALSGCALVLGDIPSLREVWGPAALYVPPNDHAALQAALRRLIDDDGQRTCLAARARQRATRYGPRSMLAAYQDAYLQIKAQRETGVAACAS